jgi:hypothetical protein
MSKTMLLKTLVLMTTLTLNTNCVMIQTYCGSDLDCTID